MNFPGYDSGYVGFFAGLNPAIQDMAIEIASDPAGWLKFYLLRRGWKRRTIKWLISKSFSTEAADNASKARYCKKTKRVISGAEVARRERNAKIDALGIIDRSLGLTKADREREMAATEQRAEMEGTLSMPALTAGSYAEFEFGDDMSVNTKSGKISKGGVSEAGDTLILD